MQGSEKAWALCSIVLLGLLAAISYHAVVAWAFDAGYPSNTFLYRPHLHFSDFYDIFRPVQMGSPLGSQAAVYFPFAYVPLYPLIWMSPQAALVTTTTVFAAGTFYFVWRKLDSLSAGSRGVAAAILTFASYPFLFAVTRGNLEMIVLLFLFGFIALFERGKYLAAGALLACATAMKLYPGVYGVLLLQRRQYKASALTAALTLVLTLLAASTFPGGISGTALRLVGNLEFFKEHYILSAGTIYFSSGYFSVLKLFVRIAGFDVPLVMEALRLPYAVLSIAAFAAITLFILRTDGPLWKKAALLCFAMILLPEVSFDYRLAHILLPLGLFVAAPPGDVRHDRLYALLFGLLLIPKAYAPIGFEVTLGVVANPLLMTLMMAHILWTGWRPGVEQKQAA
jgi:hypothetical protein